MSKIMKGKEGDFIMYKKELNFVCDTLRRCHIRTSIVSPSDAITSVIDSHFYDIMGIFFDKRFSILTHFGEIESTTKYKFVDEFNLCYIYLRLPSDEAQNILFIGPYLSLPHSSEDILELGEKLGIAPRAKEHLEEYYRSIPVITDGDRIFAMIDAFCEHIWHSPTFTITEVNKPISFSAPAISVLSHGNNFDDTLANVNMTEIRYSFENELIQAITMGQLHKENLLLSAFNEDMFEKRISDPIRNAKNYCIIMNTLSRKATEQGGVHPFYIDRVSSKFAAKIEQIASLKEVPTLMREMFCSYCQLVRTYTTQKYLPVVQKTMLLIDSDLSAELSLHSLASQQGISDGYLSTVFKKETGKTVSQYIQEKRIKHAMHLLDTTHLQVQTIALHCGIMDMQYFSKIFKKHTGKTPKEYRKSNRLK